MSREKSWWECTIWIFSKFLLLAKLLLHSLPSSNFHSFPLLTFSFPYFPSPTLPSLFPLPYFPSFPLPYLLPLHSNFSPIPSATPLFLSSSNTSPLLDSHLIHSPNPHPSLPYFHLFSCHLFTFILLLFLYLYFHTFTPLVFLAYFPYHTSPLFHSTYLPYILTFLQSPPPALPSPYPSLLILL